MATRCAAATSPKAAETSLQLIGAGFAGARFEGSVGTGQCVRIMTGAVMPAGLDTVVPQEFTKLDGERVRIPAGVVRAGDNRRLAGEDLARGAVALSAGRVLRPADIGMLASLGLAEVAVRRRLRVAFFSTGSELRSLGEPLEAGAVYDSNRYTLWSMLQRLGVEVRRPRRRARRSGRARGRLRESRRAMPTPSSPRAASASAKPTTPSSSWPGSATSCSGASRCVRAGRWRSAASKATGAAPCCSACPAIRSR